MTHNIIIAADEELACPKCGHHYPLDQGITRQTIERYEADFEAILKVRREELEILPLRQVALLSKDKQTDVVRQHCPSLGWARADPAITRDRQPT